MNINLKWIWGAASVQDYSSSLTLKVTKKKRRGISIKINKRMPIWIFFNPIKNFIHWMERKRRNAFIESLENNPLQVSYIDSN